LVLTGGRPDHNAGVAELLAQYGHSDFGSYVVWVCERALERGLCPTRISGCWTAWDLERLRAVTASHGLMLESVSERLMETVHARSPTKHPARRLQTVACASELRIPLTTGILVGIGEREEERIASLKAWPSCMRATGICRR
jgi:FO synthase